MPLRCALLALFSAWSMAGQPALYQQALAAVQQGALEPAIIILEKLVAESPGDLRAGNLLGVALSGAGRGEEAAVQFRRVLDRDPSFVPALKNLALNESAMGKLRDARSHFEKALKLAPRDPALHFGLAQLEFQENHFAAALQHFDYSNGLYLRDPRALLSYAASAIQTSQPGAAAQALRNFPPEAGPSLHLEAGAALAKLEFYGDAAREFSVARARGVSTPESGFDLALAQLRNKDFAAAAQTAREVIASSGKTPELLSLLAEAEEGAGRTEDAYNALRAATQIAPQAEPAYLELIALCALHENYGLALEIADVGIRLLPASHRLHTQRGIVLAMNGRLDDALADFDTSPNEPLSVAAKALVLMRADRTQEAVRSLRKRPLRESYLNGWLLAEGLTRLGVADTGEAMSALQESIALNPRLPQSRLLLGKMLLGKGETAAAVAQLEKALELEPANTAAAYQLAQAYRKKGDAARAAELFARVGEAKNPENHEQSTGAALLRIVKESSAQ